MDYCLIGLFQVTQHSLKLLYDCLQTGDTVEGFLEVLEEEGVLSVGVLVAVEGRLVVVDQVVGGKEGGDACIKNVDYSIKNSIVLTITRRDALFTHKLIPK